MCGIVGIVAQESVAQTIYDALPDAALLVEGSQMPLEKRPSIMDVFMTTQDSVDAPGEDAVHLYVPRFVPGVSGGLLPVAGGHA